jgi:hypothetical protein
VPSSAEMHGLVQVVPTDVSLVEKALLALMPHDEYSNSGCQAMGLEISSADLARIQKKLENIVKVWLHVTTGEQKDLEINLSGLQGRSIGKS